MQCDKTTFQKECNKVVRKLTEQDVEQFKSLESDEERVRFIYHHAKSMLVELKDGGKNLKEARDKKEEGNALFAGKDYEGAIRAYNEGIVKCPQNEGCINKTVL